MPHGKAANRFAADFTTQWGALATAVPHAGFKPIRAKIIAAGQKPVKAD
jgi:hypothetical protein